jgi:hypothetical protein
MSCGDLLDAYMKSNKSVLQCNCTDSDDKMFLCQLNNLMDDKTITRKCGFHELKTITNILYNKQNIRNISITTGKNSDTMFTLFPLNTEEPVYFSDKLCMIKHDNISLKITKK